MKSYYHNNPKTYLLIRCKSHAKERDQEFSISEKDIIIPEYCPYLGIKLVFGLGKKQSSNSMSIDRIDPTRGYVPGNVQVISMKANTMKNDASPEELVRFARAILKEELVK